jgi:hypothetical protein
MTAMFTIESFIFSLLPPCWTMREEDAVLQPFDGMMRWTDSLALGRIIELIERLPCPGLRSRVFQKRERTPTSGSKGLTTDYLLISPVFGK